MVKMVLFSGFSFSNEVAVDMNKTGGELWARQRP